MDRATSCGCFSVVYPGNASITTRVKIGDHDILPQDLGSTVKNECVCGITVSTGSCTPDEEDTSRFMHRGLLDSDDRSIQITDIIKACKQLHKARTDTIKTTVHSIASGQLIVHSNHGIFTVVTEDPVNILSTKGGEVVSPGGPNRQIMHNNMLASDFSLHVKKEGVRCSLVATCRRSPDQKNLASLVRCRFVNVNNWGNQIAQVPQI